jgi:hypothetical protein
MNKKTNITQSLYNISEIIKTFDPIFYNEFNKITQSIVNQTATGISEERFCSLIKILIHFNKHKNLILLKKYLYEYLVLK